ncbi:MULTISPECIES: RagB/SusD family nutrient uptake outer membrane protein [Spirosoma]|uniref:RagB/SusD family nutrient uptake outer membrane protein n=1 Tax=Spirosoma liriopis TaxID=2937440 RepID=A0ABT0HIY0_9BACT|nr:MULTISPECIES: RagB/SusD family nutrient uptake outer membrane protein [Spirosoma]MCK8492102.1 RagB/SusD family nutrient uptake outer membrane protein [Spirosoma liriopis]UHG91523.1 RagB/SusD family nutrient uptake outer membrane protein [Spirosoma oryzicola]
MKPTYWTTGIVAIGLFFGCSTDNLDKVNPNQFTTETYFKNADELVKGVNSVYAIWQSANLTGREWFFVHDLRSDDVATGGGQLEAPRNQILIGAQNPGNGVAFSVWNGLYRAVHRANVVINKGTSVTDNPTLTKRAIAEAKFLRALSYFDLVTLWGGVPLYTEYVESTSGTKARATVDEIYNLLITDLQAIQADLPASFSGADLGRATKGAAQALLARVYMQKGDYANAKTQLQQIISSGLYKLTDEYNDNFIEETEFNSESIFEIGFSKIGDFNWDGDGNDGGANETMTRSQEYSAIGWRNLIPSDGLIGEFENTAKGDAKTDPRLKYNFYFIGDTYNNGANTLMESQVQGNTSNFNGTAQKISWRKYTAMYKNNETFYTSGINMRIIRYAEVLLMMAEAENETGSTANAIALLNQVRARKSVAMPAYPTTNYPVNSKDEVFRAIVHEKRVEQGGEQIRNRDLLRWRAQNKLKTEPISYFAKGKQELLPIPQQELDNNSKLSQKDQNPGY